MGLAMSLAVGQRRYRSTLYLAPQERTEQQEIP